LIVFFKKQKEAPMRSSGILISILFLMVFTSQAQMENPNSRCQTEKLSGSKIINVDVREMNQDNKSRFKVQDKVQIILENMNPFLFEYKVTVNAVRVPEPALEYISAMISVPKDITAAAKADFDPNTLADQIKDNLTTKELLDESEKNCLGAVIKLWK
jgi:hypothetical protein